MINKLKKVREKRIEKIKPLTKVWKGKEVVIHKPELMDKINEIIDYLNEK